MYLDTHAKKDCSGCMACSRICAHSAITMNQDPCGFYYPVVDARKCIDCGLCRKVCHMEVSLTGQDASPAIYAVHNRDTTAVLRSSSGGTFTLLAKWILEQNGVVYGVAFDDGFSVRHMRAETQEETWRFRTSKYVESDISGVYDHIREDLKSGRTVLLTGTPCQIAGVTKFLKTKRINTTKLYTCDNICHGVPSQMVWKDYLNILKEKYIAKDDEITYINMRSKKVSWREKVLDISLKNGNIDKIVKDFSFNRFFASLYGTRPSCFDCRYTSYKRPSDITLGDFWTGETAGLNFDIENGVSEVLVNTPKGQALFDLIKTQADVKPLTKKEGWQPHLEYAAKQPKNRRQFWADYHSAPDKEDILRKYMKGSLVTRLIRILSPILRRLGIYNLAGKLYKMVFRR